MSQDRPNLVELLRSVRELVDDLGPSLGAVQRYDARVASYLLEMAEREVQLGDGFAREEQQRLGALLGRDGTHEELEATLAIRLRKGVLDDRLDEVIAAMLAVVVDKVRIVKPSHLDESHR